MAETLQRPNLDIWVRRGCALVVAAVAAYASYQHQREFALHGGADATSAELWPLSVDGLLVLASTALIRNDRTASRRVRGVVWLAFLLGIGVSLAANIASAPMFGWQPMLVAGWPPVSLLLAVELLTHREKISVPETAETMSKPQRTTAEEVMWQHVEREYGQGRIPTGAELDRVAGTHNYGRAVLRRWRRTGRIGTPLGLASSPIEVETREDKAG
jgi:hypothetical protein